MSMVSVEIKRLGLQLLPLCLRKPLMAALVYAVTKPAGMLYDDLQSYRTETKEELKRNGQVCNLRRVLNDLFDSEQRGISIIDTGKGDGVTLSLRSSGRALTTPQTLNMRGYGGSSDLNFSVRLPGRLYGVVDVKRLTSVVRRYKLAGMRFGLEYVDAPTDYEFSCIALPVKIVFDEFNLDK